MFPISTKCSYITPNHFPKSCCCFFLMIVKSGLHISYVHCCKSEDIPTKYSTSACTNPDYLCFWMCSTVSAEHIGPPFTPVETK